MPIPKKTKTGSMLGINPASIADISQPAEIVEQEIKKTPVTSSEIKTPEAKPVEVTKNEAKEPKTKEPAAKQTTPLPADSAPAPTVGRNKYELVPGEEEAKVMFTLPASLYQKIKIQATIEQKPIKIFIGEILFDYMKKNYGF